MARGLLSRLHSRDPSRSVDEVQSILGSLRALLNTRTGDAPCVDDFGVLDFSDLVHNFPNATPYVQRNLRDCIAKYEPRLTNVRVRTVPSDNPLRLVFEISARLASDRRRGLVRVRTEVNGQGRFTVD